MNLSTPSPTRCTLAVLAIAVVVLLLAVPHACAADSAAALPAVLPALDMMDIVHDRSRLVQFSIAAVIIGIALLWWGNKTH